MKQQEKFGLMREQFDSILRKLLTSGPLTNEKAFRSVVMNLVRKDFLDKKELCASFISALNDPCTEIAS